MIKLHQACKVIRVDYDSEPDLDIGSLQKRFRTVKSAQDFINSLDHTERATLHVVMVSHFEILEEV